MYPDPEETAKSEQELSVQIPKRLQNPIKSMYQDPEETAKSDKELSDRIRMRLQNLRQSSVCGSGKETVKPIKSYGFGSDSKI
jgi:hypothetical protein